MRRRFRLVSLALSTALIFTLPPSSHGNTSSYAVGDKGPSGGPIVFVDKYDDYSWDYIEAAPANWMGSQSNSTMIRWSPYSSSSAGLANLSSVFGDGAKNTAAILSAFGNGWNIRSVTRDLNDCPVKEVNSRLCNVTLSFAENHKVTRFVPTSWPVLPVACDGKYIDSIVNSLTGEIKVLSPTSISFVETGTGRTLVDQILNRSDCKITYAAELANSLKIAGNSGWVLPTLDELALVQKVVGSDLKPPYLIDQNILKTNGYTSGYYSTSTLRDVSTQRVWGFTNESIAGKSGALSLTYGAAIIPIRYFKTNVPLVSLEQSAPAGPIEINGSIIQEDTRWFAKSSPIKVRGTVQIPAGVTLTIAAGSVVDLTEGNFTLLGNLVIGSNDSKQKTLVTMGSGDFIAKGSGGTLTIHNSDIKANRGSFSSMWNAMIAKLTIDNSYLEGFRSISNGQLTTLSISNSIMRKIDTITGTGFVYNFTLLDNIFEDLRSFSYPSAGVFVNTGQSPPSASVQGNLFFNNSNSLEFTLPGGSNNAESSTFRNNRLETPSKLTISGGTEAGRNYWGAVGEAAIRAAARVIDGISDITLRTISFSSALPTPPALPKNYQFLQDRIAAEKAAAEKAVADAQKAAADALLIPPPTDVSCSTSKDGVICNNSITNTRTWNIKGSPSLDWYFALLKPAQDPNQSSNYGTRALQKKSNPGQVTDFQEFSYQSLLTFAGNNPEASVLITATIVNGDGKFWPIAGKGTYVALRDLKSEIDRKAVEAKAAAEAKAIADKAAAEAKAIADKAAAEAKAIADKAAAEASRREQTITVSPFISSPIPFSASGLPINVRSSSNLSVFAYNSTNDVCEFQNGMIRTKNSGRCVIAFSQEGDSEFKPASNFILDFTIAEPIKKTTVTCIKGKQIKRVTGIKPKCPTGFKKR